MTIYAAGVYIVIRQEERMCINIIIRCGEIGLGVSLKRACAATAHVVIYTERSLPAD
jgi:hypothetical protein